MCFVETDIQKERLFRSLFDELNSGGCDVSYLHALRFYDLVVSNFGRIFGDVLNADQSGVIAVRPQPVEQVLMIVVQPEASVSQADHAVLVRTCPVRSAARLGEHVGAASKA